MVTISLAIAVSGCPTRCLHCSRLGGPNYPRMEVSDLEMILERFSAFCQHGSGYRLNPCEMHAVFVNIDDASVNIDQADLWSSCVRCDEALALSTTSPTGCQSRT